MIEVLGYAASSAVLATFLMRTMLPLRLVAILSNVLFLLYGYFAHILPVLCLHMALLPINVARLMTLRDRCNPGQCVSTTIKQQLATHPEYYHRDHRL